MSHPTIIFIQTDQQRFDALGVENPIVQTPHLDRLAARGIRYRQAICNSPQCVPSRYSMMLGLLPSQAGVRNNGQSIGNDRSLPGPTLPQQMLDAGYQTAAFGKTHWYGENFTNQPTMRGFETYFKPRADNPNVIPPGVVTMESDEPEHWAAYRDETVAWGTGGESVGGYVGSTSRLPGENHREGWMARRCLRWLDEGRDGSRPLFLYFSLDFPHAGLNIPPGYEDRYRLKDIPDRPTPPWAEPMPRGGTGPLAERGGIAAKRRKVRGSKRNLASAVCSPRA